MSPQQRRRLVVAFLVVVTTGTAIDSGAQTRAQMIGTIRNGAGEALAGVVMELKSPTVPGEAQTTITNARGMYRFADLPPAVYELTATLQGWQTAKRVELRVPVGTTVTLDLTLREGEATDVVTLSSPAPVVDVTTAASTTKLTTEDLENLPTGGGPAILQLAPGVTPNSAFGSGADTSVLTVDGGPIKDPRGMALSAAFQPYWMQEAQIVGLGADAEYGDFSGVVADIVTRSGSNQLSGLVEYSATPSRLVADNTGGLAEALRSQFPPLEIQSLWTSDAQAGGPIKRDRLFFFAGFHHLRRLTVQPGTIGNVPLDVQAPAFVTRLTGAPGRNLRLEGGVQADSSRSRGILSRNSLPETAGDQNRRMRSWNARATWISNSRTLVEVRTSGVDLQQEILAGDRRLGPPRRVDRITGIASGNAGSFGDTTGSRYITGASLTRFADGFAGRSHELELGLEVERTTNHQVSGFPGGRLYTDVSGVPGVVMLWDGDTVEGTGTRTTLYAQDAWSAAGRLTIRPGVRIGFNRGAVPDKGTVFRTNPVAPRIGVAWDVSPDHKTVVRGAYDRIHEGLYTSAFEFMNTYGRTPRINARVVGPDTFVETNRTSPGNGAIDDGLAHAYVDQYLVGIERELFPDFSLTLQYVRRDFGDIWAVSDTGSQYSPVLGRDPGPDGQLNTADDGGLVTVFNLLNPGQQFTVLTNPDNAFRQYHAFQAIGQKRFSRNWQVLGAYTWSRARGNVNGAGGDGRGSGLDTGGTNGVFFNPNRFINAEGPIGFDYSHQLNVQGTYLVPAWGGLWLSGGYRYLSGGAWGRTALIVGQQLSQGQNVRIEPRGTRRIESGSSFDTRIEKTFSLGGSGRTLGVYADVFNLTNEGVPLGLTLVEGSGATFGQPTFWADPRTVRIAARFRF